MEFGFFAFVQATTVLLAGVVEALVPIAAHPGTPAAQGLHAALRATRNLDTILTRVEAEGGELERENARNVARTILDSLPTDSAPGASTAHTRALRTTSDCARALHRALATPISSSALGARVFAHGLDSASALAGVLTVALAASEHGALHRRRARRLTLGLARARDLAMETDLTELRRDLDRTRTEALSLAVSSGSGEGGMPLWIFFSLGRALGRLDRAIADGEQLPPPGSCLVLDLKVPVDAAHESVLLAVVSCATSLSELHALRRGSHLFFAQVPEPGPRQAGHFTVQMRFLGSEGGGGATKQWIAQQIAQLRRAETRAAPRESGGLRVGRLQTRSWQPLRFAEVIDAAVEEVEQMAFAHEQAALTSRLANLSSPPGESSEEENRAALPWSAPAQRVVAAVVGLEAMGGSATLRTEAGKA